MSREAIDRALLAEQHDPLLPMELLLRPTAPALRELCARMFALLPGEIAAPEEDDMDTTST